MLNIDKLKLLHAIRGFAAFYVVVSHSKFILWCGGTEYLAKYPRVEWSIWRYLIFGLDILSSSALQMVIIFFVLSGFFIAYSFDKNKQTAKDFYINRAIRIYVPYLSSIALAVGVLYLIGLFDPSVYRIHNNREFNQRLISAYHDLTISNFLKSLVFLPGNEYIGFNLPYWSLLYEGMFYLVVPFMIPRPRLYLWLSVVVFASGLFIFHSRGINNAVLSFLFEFNIFFAVGQYLYHNITAIKNKLITIPWAKSVLVTSSALTLMMMVSLRFLYVPSVYINLMAGGLCCMLIILFISFDFTHNTFLAGMKKLGEISFSLYLIHMPILTLCYALIHKIFHIETIYAHVYPIGVLCSLIVSIYFYKWIEEPSVGLIRLIKSRKAQVA